jgi:septal ring factor EnvC (AmiA/AmiB activator)
MSAVPEAEYLTVKEAADVFGVSVQAVYQRLDKDFKPYLKVVEGKKRLDKRVFELNNKVEFSSGLTSDFKEILKLLEKQLDEKDRQLSVKDKQIDDLSNRLAESNAALVAAQQTAQAAQALHAGTIRQQLKSGDGDPAELEETPPGKRGFFSRIFGKER